LNPSTGGHAKLPVADSAMYADRRRVGAAHPLLS
jgi:hypothetical protein